MSKRKKIMIIAIIVFAFLLIEWLFIGYRFNYGPFKSLGDIRMSRLEGNDEKYAMSTVEPMTDSPLKGKSVLFLGSSVTYGSASLRDGIPEYFSQRFGCNYTKEAVSGTTLVDNGKASYVQRLINNVDNTADYDLVICQLSTNDASKKMPLGEIADGRELGDFDTSTVTGAMEYIIAYVEKTYGCKVVFYTEARYDNEEYAKMVERTYDLGDKWDIGILDLWSDDGFNSISDSERELYMYDSIHPTRAGYRDWWCPEMEEQLIEYLN